MPIVNETSCLKKLPEERIEQLEFLATWVSAREWSRAHQGDKSYNAMSVFHTDELFYAAWAAFKKGQEYDIRTPTPGQQLAFVEAFLQAVFSLSPAEGALVGWDNESCVMNWYSYACLCSYYARMSLPDAIAAMAELQTKKVRPQWACSPEVLSDQIYDCEWPMPNQSCQDEMSWKSWVVPVGILVVGAGLAWWMFGSKRNPIYLAQENPARKSSHFVVRMSDTEDGDVLLVVQGPGAAKWAKKYKQSAAGSSWEADGPDFAYTIVSNYPDLVKDLKLERYNLDQSEYTPPDDG